MAANDMSGNCHHAHSCYIIQAGASALGGWRQRVRKLTIGLRRCSSWPGCNGCAGAAFRALESADDG